jgi:hypothetical protein
MRKIAVLLSIGLFVGMTPNAAAATNPKVVTAAFNKVLSSTENSLEAIELKYEKDLDVLDETLFNATKAAEVLYDQELLAATNTFAPQIAAANKKIDDAKKIYQANNKLIVKRSLFSSPDRERVWQYFICPKPQVNEAGWMIAKRYCNNDYGYEKFGDRNKVTGMTVGGEDWQPEDQAEVSLENSGKQYILDAISYGWLVPVNQVLFDSSRLAVKNESTNVENLISQQGKERTSAQGKKDRAIALATAARESALAELDELYQMEKERLEAQQMAAELALLAAKRATRDASNFDSAFVVAYKFEYNRQMVNEIADASWTGEWTYRTIDSILKVNRLAVTGDSIASKYTRSAANAFNTTVGNAFTNEVSFRAALKVLTTTYKQATKSTLKF